MTLNYLSRTQMLIGEKGLEKLKSSKVAIFGVGGVGSFTAEALARCGVGSIVLVDKDDICISNINRQIHALNSTVGRPKVDVMKARIFDINPEAKVTAHIRLYNIDTSDELLFDDYDYVVDAIDMVSSKLDLIERCKSRKIPIISAMGAGNKLNPTMLEVDDIYRTSVCPLAKVMRKELRRRGVESLKVVYSKEEPIRALNIDDACEDRSMKTRSPGSVSFVPSVSGLIIASEVVKDLIK